MNKVILYWKKTREDETWAMQFAGDDASLVSFYAPANFPPGTNLPDFPIRKRLAIATAVPTWGAFMRGVEDAAALAGYGGIVCLLGGPAVRLVWTRTTTSIPAAAIGTLEPSSSILTSASASIKTSSRTEKSSAT